MAQRRRRSKVVSVRRKRPINIDLVFFGAVAVYICVICYMGMNSEHIAGYEVNAGSLSVNHTYTGFAIRQERFTRQVPPVMSATMPGKENAYPALL